MNGIENHFKIGGGLFSKGQNLKTTVTSFE